MRSLEGALLHPRWLATVAALACALRGSDARAEVQPLRISYEAHEGCPSTAAFLRELIARTSRARAAAPDEAALDVHVSITRSGGAMRGRITLGEGKDARVREVSSPTCAEVVAALALITALRVDPTASLVPEQAGAEEGSSQGDDPGGAANPTGAAPPAGTAAPAGAAPPAGTAASAGAAAPSGGEAAPPASPPGAAPPAASVVGPPARDVRPAPTPALRPQPDARTSGAPKPLPVGRAWTLGLQASAATGVAPEALLGGGPFLELRADLGLRASFRFAAELAATGDVDAGPGGARFLRGIGRLDACLDLLDLYRPAPELSLSPCLGGEGGVLHASGLVGEAIAETNDAAVPWASVGLLARMTASFGGIVRVDVDGGPQFPLVRRSFVFESPAQLIHEVPAVAWRVHLGAGLSF